VNALRHAKQAYSAAKSPTRTVKNLEYDAIARITHKLVSAADKGPEGFNTLVAAPTDNRRLWTIFMADIASPNNQLPQELKEHLVYLTEFTRHHTSKVLARKADIKPLVDINTAIMRGLRSGAT